MSYFHLFWCYSLVEAISPKQVQWFTQTHFAVSQKDSRDTIRTAEDEEIESSLMASITSDSVELTSIRLLVTFCSIEVYFDCFQNLI